MTIPAEGDAAPGKEYSALTLFLQTARRVQAGFAPTAADQAAIVRICQLAAGMPLALELAAAWVRVLSCREIAEEIASSLGFLTATQRDLSSRHRSMQAVFDHSWRLLTAAEQGVFARCFVFRGGFTREAAAQVADATLPMLTALVDKSLFSRQREGRYAIHELARQYAAARLEEAQQVAQTRHHHLTFFMHFAETAEPHLNSGAQVGQWHERVENEHDNLRSALDWSFASGELEPGLRIVGALWEFWMNRGHAGEGQTQAERFLARPEAAARTYMRARAMHTAGVLAFYQGRHHMATSWLTEAIALSRELGPMGQPVLAMALIALGYTSSAQRNITALHRLSQESLTLGRALQIAWVEGDALHQLGLVELFRGNFAHAHGHFHEAFACYQADGQGVARGTMLRYAGLMLYEQGDYAAAEAHLYQSLTIFEGVGDKRRSSAALRQLGCLALAQDNVAEAQKLLTNAFLLVREATHTPDYILTVDVMGRLAQRQGDYGRACDLHQESLALSLEISHQAFIADSLEAFACLAAVQGQAERAAVLFGAAEASHPARTEQAHFWRATRDPGLGGEHDRLVALVRAVMGEAGFAAAWAVGAAMDLARVVNYALASGPWRQPCVQA